MHARSGCSATSATIEVFVSPGGYILGEETALLEAMEGQRGEPRNKPPFPGKPGSAARPTLINNGRDARRRAGHPRRGADWWQAQGVNGCAGLKFFAVSGDVEQPGVYCVPMGTTVGELIELAGGVRGGRPLAAVQPGRRLVGLPRRRAPRHAARLQDAERRRTMLGSGAVVVCAEGRDCSSCDQRVALLPERECGKCVPCRVGTEKSHQILTEHLSRGGTAGDVPPQIGELEETLRLTSICGLGQVALGPVASVLRMDERARNGSPASP